MTGQGQPPGQDQPDSHLTRRERLERDHPEVQIRLRDGRWQAVITEPGAELVMVHRTLDELLDRLEAVLSQRK